MPNPQIYTTELARFRNKYNMPEYDLNALAGVDQKFQHLNNFLFESSTTANPAAQFVNWASRTMAMYFKANTNLRADGKYMSGFNPQAFLRDFENLAKAKYESELSDGEEPTRKKFAGARKRDLKSILVNNFKDMNKTLPTLWAEKLKKGTMTQNDLLLTTSNVMDNVDGIIKGNNAPLKDQIINVVAAYEAMKQVRESRTGFLGWLWKFIFRERNEIEEANLNLFESQVNQLREKGYSVDKISADLTGKTVLGLEVESRDKVVENQPEERNNQANVEESEHIENSNLELKEDELNKEKVQEKNLATQLQEKAGVHERYRFSEKISPTLPQPAVGDVDMVKIGVENFVGEVMKEFDAFNEKFEKQMKAGKKETAMAEYALKVFSIALVSTQQIEFDSAKESIITAQKVTDAFLKQFSPCSMDESLQKFADNYAIKNSDKIIDSLKAKVEPFLQNKLDEGFKDVREELFPGERVQVFGEENPFVESHVNKSAPVHQQPQISVPSIDKK